VKGAGTGKPTEEARLKMAEFKRVPPGENKGIYFRSSNWFILISRSMNIKEYGKN